MNIWIDILHTPQLNYYKPLIARLSKEGYTVYVSVLGRGKLPVIARKELGELNNVIVSVIGKHRMKKWSVILEANILRLLHLLVWCLGKRIDVAFSNGSHVGMMGKIFGFPAYEFEDDPQAADYKLMVGFSTQNHSLLYKLPTGYTLHPKDCLLSVLKEWSYLSPKEFIPDESQLAQYGLKKKSYLFVREVSVGTLNYSDQEPDSILQIAGQFPKDTTVILSLEKKDKRDKYPADWILLQEPIKDIHSLIYYSKGLISSGDSMAREAALLGVPSYYLGVRYSMPANAAAAEVANLQNRKTMPVNQWFAQVVAQDNDAMLLQENLRKKMDNTFIDINEYMHNLVEQVKIKKK